MHPKYLTQVSFLWLTLAFSQQTLEGGLSIIWILLICSLSLFHLKIIPQLPYRFSYLLSLSFLFGLAWLISPNSPNAPFFWNEFWWVQASAAAFSVLFLIFKRNQNSVFWHAAMAAITLFFSFYLWESPLAYAQIALAFLGFLILAMPKVPHRSIPKSTWLLWIFLAGSSYATVLTWKHLYPSYREWAYKKYYNTSNPQKGFQSNMKIGTFTEDWDDSKDNEVMIRLWGERAPLHLKGISYSIYKKGEWFPTRKHKFLFPKESFVEHSVYKLPLSTAQASFEPKFQIQNTSELSDRLFIPLNWNSLAVLEDSISYNLLDFFDPTQAASQPYFLSLSKSSLSPKPNLNESQVPKHLHIPLLTFIQKHNLHLSDSLPQDLQKVFQKHFSYSLTPPVTVQIKVI
jgi:hypothetical protein